MHVPSVAVQATVAEVRCPDHHVVVGQGRSGEPVVEGGGVVILTASHTETGRRGAEVGRHTWSRGRAAPLTH